MNKPLAGAGEAGVARVDVEDLYLAYCELLDARRFDDWLGLFTEDCEYRVVSAENVALGMPLSTMRAESRAMLADRIYTIEHTQMFTPRQQRHFLSALRAAPTEAADDGSLTATANFLIVETLPGEPTTLYCAGRYDDVITMSGEGLRFARKVAVHDSPLIQTSMIYPL